MVRDTCKKALSVGRINLFIKVSHKVISRDVMPIISPIRSAIAHFHILSPHCARSRTFSLLLRALERFLPLYALFFDIRRNAVISKRRLFRARSSVAIGDDCVPDNCRVPAGLNREKILMRPCALRRVRDNNH